MSDHLIAPVAKKRRFVSGMPLDFSRNTLITRNWRWMASACLALSVLPLTIVLTLGWVFALRVVAMCVLGAWKPRTLWFRISLLLFDLFLMLWWMTGGYSQSLPQTSLGIFILGLSFKAVELKKVGDGYMASVICFLAPFLAITQGLPWWIILLSSLSILASMALRSGLACIESGSPTGQPWSAQHWRPVFGLTLMSVPIAIVAFFLLPRLSLPLWGGEKSGKTGMSDTMEPGAFDAMMRDPSSAFFVSFKDKVPEKKHLYWRATTLSLFDGRVWSPLPLPPSAESLPTYQKGVASFSYDISMMPQRSNFVPFLDRVLAVGSRHAIETYTLTYVSPDKTKARMPYSAVSSPNVKWSPDGLSDQALRANLQVKEGYNPRTRRLVKSWQENGLAERALVNHALMYFRENMTYSYTPPLLGRNSVDELLFETREGFCEHFSSSFTFMMRSAGIPARVVTGYQGGRLSPDNRWEVRQLDAHAWSEVWLEGEGWVRIDPTFAVVRQRPPPPGETQSQGLDLPWMQWVGERSSKWIGGFNERSQQDLFSNWKTENWWHWLIVILGVLALLAWAVSAFLWDWNTTRAPKEVVQFEKLRKVLLSKTGLSISATPRQLASGMREHLSSEEMAQLSLVLQAWEDWRYGNQENAGLVQQLRNVRKNIKRSKKE